jgi:hypothetical protein
MLNLVGDRSGGGMTVSTIRKGFILKARKIEDSEIAHAPPHVREVWDLILRKANFKDYRCGGTIIRRGQWLTTYTEIQELLHWRIGFRKVTYSRWQIEWAMKKLRTWVMIATQKATRGLFITVVNYDLYQTPDNYDCHTDCHNDCHNDATGQRRMGKNVKKEEGAFAPPTPTQVDEYAILIGYHKPNLGRDFCQKYDALDWRIKGGKKMENWKLTVQTWRKRDERNPQNTEGSVSTIYPKTPADCQVSDPVRQLLAAGGSLPPHDPNCIHCHRPGTPARIGLNNEGIVYYVCASCHKPQTVAS